MIINVLNATFETVTYVEQGIEILDAFMHLSAREVCSGFWIINWFIFWIGKKIFFFIKKAIRRTIDKKTVDVYQLFMEDLNTVKREITSRNVTLDRMHPNYAGAALWAKGLKRRIER